MNEEDKNIESLEEELKELKKKKLLKEIKELENNLGIKHKKSNNKKISSTPVEIKKINNNFYYFAFAFGAILSIYITQVGNFNLFNSIEDKLENTSSQPQQAEVTSTTTTIQESDIAEIQGLKVDISCYTTYKGGDKSSDPILKVKISINNSTKVQLSKMSIFVSPTPSDFRDYFKNDNTTNRTFMKTVYYQIDNKNKDKEHFVYFYIGSMGLGKPVAKCSTFFN